MRSSDPRPLRLIALFKLLKAAFLMALGLGALQLLRADTANLLEQWVQKFGFGPGSRLIGHLILKAAALPPNRIKELALGSWIYAGLFLTEGFGLWFLKRWAEWFTVLVTASLVPVEAYELARRPTAARVLLLGINLAVVGFLLYRLRTERSAGRSGSVPAA